MLTGFPPFNQKLYNFLQTHRSALIFKRILENQQKGINENCDAELVLRAITDIKNYNKVIIITGGGDFYCLVKY